MRPVDGSVSKAQHDSCGTARSNARTIRSRSASGSRSAAHARVTSRTTRSSSAPVGLIPPMVAHAFRGLADGSILVDIPSSEEVTSSDFFLMKPGSVPYDLGAGWC